MVLEKRQVLLPYTGSSNAAVCERLIDSTVCTTACSILVHLSVKPTPNTPWSGLCCSCHAWRQGTLPSGNAKYAKSKKEGKLAKFNPRVAIDCRALTPAQVAARLAEARRLLRNAESARQYFKARLDSLQQQFIELNKQQSDTMQLMFDDIDKSSERPSNKPSAGV